jgi:hypothetical protein
MPDSRKFNFDTDKLEFNFDQKPTHYFLKIMEM